MPIKCKVCKDVGIIIEPRVGNDAFHKRVYCCCQADFQDRWYLDEDGLWKKVLRRGEFQQGAGNEQ